MKVEKSHPPPFGGQADQPILATPVVPNGQQQEIGAMLTWPREAAAMEVGEKSEKIWEAGTPSSSRRICMASTSEKGGILSCSFSSSRE